MRSLDFGLCKTKFSPGYLSMFTRLTVDNRFNMATGTPPKHNELPLGLTLPVS